MSDDPTIAAPGNRVTNPAPITFYGDKILIEVRSDYNAGYEVEYTEYFTREDLKLAFTALRKFLDEVKLK
jgi:hypothetical protein